MQFVLPEIGKIETSGRMDLLVARQVVIALLSLEEVIHSTFRPWEVLNRVFGIGL